MAENLKVTFDGPKTHSGVPLEDLQKTLQHVQNAVRYTVEHLLGLEISDRGRPKDVVRRMSGLSLRGTAPGSLVVDLALTAAAQGQLFDDDAGPRALDAILNFHGDRDQSVPSRAVDELNTIGFDLSQEVNSVWLGDSHSLHRLQFEREDTSAPSLGSQEEALLYGWLKEVDWEKKTARLYDSEGEHVSLKFDAEFGNELLRLATQYVKVTGTGRFNKRGDWTTVAVKRIDGTRSWDQPFDLRLLMEQPSGKVFDPETVITTDEPFDVDEFISVIHRARDIDDTRAHYRQLGNE